MACGKEVLVNNTKESLECDLQTKLQEYLVKYPGEEKRLASFLRVSTPTIKRWSEGRNLPHLLLIPSAITAIQRLMTKPR
jgi:hypothetical protein